MLLSPLIRFLGVSDHLPKRAQYLIQKFLVIASAYSSLFFISGTFYVLFVLDIVSFEELGKLAALSFIVQAVFDYPSGTLGDWIGQRWILAIAFISFGISYWFLAFADSFESLAIVYILSAFAASQESGALQAWFDNNYKTATEDIDSERTIYQKFLGKFNMIQGFIWAFTILIGGFIATYLFRETVFVLQAIGMIILGIISLFVIKDLPGTTKPEQSVKKYFGLLKEGVMFVLTTKHIFFFVAGLCLLNSMWLIWGNMILFPMYYGYTGSDLGAGIFRFIAWINQSATASYAGKISAKMNFRHWIPRLEWFVMFGYYSFFAIILFIFPLQDKLNLAPIALVIVAFAFFDFCVNIMSVLRQRFYLDAIPDHIRNSIYSLIPTTVLIVSAFIMIFAGSFIEQHGFSITLILMACVGTIAALIMYYGFRVMPQDKSNSDKDLVTHKINPAES
jgi:MFS family permease